MGASTIYMLLSLRAGSHSKEIVLLPYRGCRWLTLTGISRERSHCIDKLAEAANGLTYLTDAHAGFGLELSSCTSPLLHESCQEAVERARPLLAADAASQLGCLSSPSA